MATSVIFIPGMFNPFINTFLGTYFIDQMEYLKAREIPFDIMPVHTEGSIEKNAKIIRERILNKKNLVAFCHSKGGVDLLHTLIIYPELRSHFKKIIFAQCPFFGTPLADMAMKSETLTATFFKLVLKGDVISINELSRNIRTSYMKTHADEIQKIISEIRIECIGSSKKPEAGRFDSILKIPRDFIELTYKLPNDGMIPTESALIPGTKHTVFQDLDHASAVIRFTPQVFDRLAFTHAVFEEALA